MASFRVGKEVKMSLIVAHLLQQLMPARAKPPVTSAVLSGAITKRELELVLLLHQVGKVEYRWHAVQLKEVLKWEGTEIKMAKACKAKVALRMVNMRIENNNTSYHPQMNY
jgi:hypothetical protein